MTDTSIKKRYEFTPTSKHVKGVDNISYFPDLNRSLIQVEVERKGGRIDRYLSVITYEDARQIEERPKGYRTARFNEVVIKSNGATIAEMTSTLAGLVQEQASFK